MLKIMASNIYLETDAQGESTFDTSLHPDPIPTRSQSSRSDNNHVLASLSTPERLQRSGNLESSDKITASDDYRKYIHLMPSELKHDYFEILIICAQSDEEKADAFKKYLLSLGYRVQILEIGSPVEMEQAYQRAMFFFLFVTKEFCRCTTALFRSHIFLSQTLNDESKNWSVVPVLTTGNRDEIKLDILLRNLHPIRYFKKDKDENTIKKLLEGKTREMAIRDWELHLQREQYYKDKKSVLFDLEIHSSLKTVEYNKQTKDTEMKAQTTRYTRDDTLVKKNGGITEKSVGNYNQTEAGNKLASSNLLEVQLKSNPASECLNNDVQIDGPASQDIQSPPKLTPSSSCSSSSPTMNPTAQTEIPHKAENERPGTHIHYHTTLNVENLTNLVVGDHGNIRYKKVNEENNLANNDDLDVLKIDREASMNPISLNPEASPPRSKPNLTDCTYNPRKNYVGVFWDLQNCPVPKKKSAADIIKLIREKLIQVNANNEEKRFCCITDAASESEKTRQEINSCGVNLLDICSDKDNSSDFKIIQEMEEFARDIGNTRGIVILITSDVDFNIKLADLKKKGHYIILIHREQIKPELLNNVDESHSYEELIAELPDKHEILLENDPFLIVHGYQPLSKDKKKNFIQSLNSCFEEWNGKVINQRGTKFGILKFDSFELAKSAKEKTNGKEPFEPNNKVTVCFMEDAPDDIRKSVEKILNLGKRKTEGKNQSCDRSLTSSNSERIAENEIQDVGSDPLVSIISNLKI